MVARAVVFDFDGTLVRQTIDFALMRREIVRVVAAYGADSPDIVDMHLLELVDAAAALLGDEAQRERLRRETYAVIEEIECEAAGRATVLPGADAMLAELRRRGILTAVVTRNSERAVRTAFPGVDAAVDVFLPREAVRFVKPHPEHLDLCLARLQTAPGDTLMVGDHPLDVEAGRAHGMRTVGVLTGSGSEADLRAAGPDYVLSDVTQVLGLLR